MSQVILQTQGLSKMYGKKQALAPLDVELRAGEVLDLLGVNGSGKSTLIKLAAGLIRPTAGQVLILGERPSPHTKFQVAYMPETDHLYTSWNAEGAYRFFDGFFPMQRERFTYLLDFLRIDRAAEISTLSKGNRTRLRLALTLARDAKLYLLGEPLSGIDPLTREDILRALVREFSPKSAVILATHQVAEAESLFDKVVVLDGGSLLMAGSAEEIRVQQQSSVKQAIKNAAKAKRGL